MTIVSLHCCTHQPCVYTQLRIVYGATNVPSGATDEAKKAAREKFAAGTLRVSLGLYEDRLKKTTGPFLLGDQVSLADLWAFFLIPNILNGGVRVLGKRGNVVW